MDSLDMMDSIVQCSYVEVNHQHRQRELFTYAGTAFVWRVYAPLYQILLSSSSLE